MYATVTDLEGYVGADELTLLADRDGDGARDSGVIEQVLAQTDAEIDGYVAGRYDLPLDAGRAVILKQSAMDIAIYRLCTNEALLTDSRRQRFEDARRFLRDIARGEISIGQPGRAPQPSAPAVASSAPRRFTRKAMGL